MPLSWNKARQAWHWQFKATVDGRVHRFSKLLPRAWSEAQARRYDEQETARTYSSIAAGERRVSTVPLIETAVALYLREVAAKNKDGKKAAQQLAALLPYYQGRGLDRLGEVSRTYIAAHPTLAPATVRQRLAYLKAAARHAQKHHALGSVEWISQITLPAVKNERAHFLSRADILKITRACTDRATRALILMTYATGSRPGECHRAQRDGDQLVIVDTKNGASTIKPIPPHLVRYLRYWPMPHGYTYYAKHWRAARTAAGFPHIWQHDLRHSTASSLIAQGATLAQVGLVLDHKSAHSTRRYTHLATEEKARLLAGLWGRRG